MISANYLGDLVNVSRSSPAASARSASALVSLHSGFSTSFSRS